MKKQLGSGSKQRRIIPTKSTKKPVARGETFLQTFLVGHVKQHFSVPIFCRSVCKSWRERPKCWQCPVLERTRNLSNYLTSWKLQRVWISKRSESLRWFQTAFLALKLKFVNGRGYDTYENKEKKREHKDESAVFTEGRTGEEEEVARITYVNNIMYSIFSDVKVNINNQQIYNSNGLYAHKPYISINFKGAITEYK